MVDGVTLQANAPDSLQIGDHVIVFAIQTEIAWRDPNQPIQLLTNAEGTSYFEIGKRTIFDFISRPANSYLLEGENGLYDNTREATFQEGPISLNELMTAISEKRKTSAQPNFPIIRLPLPCPQP